MTVDELYEQYENALRRYAIGLTRNSDGADDLVQETFIRAMGHLDLLDALNQSQRRSWLFRTLKNLLIDEHRALQREQKLLDQMGAEQPISDPGLMSDIEWHELLDLIPNQYRELIQYRYVLGMNSTEIAQELGIPPATVRSRLHLATKHVRKYRTQFL